MRARVTYACFYSVLPKAYTLCMSSLQCFLAVEVWLADFHISRETLSEWEC